MIDFLTNLVTFLTATGIPVIMFLVGIAVLGISIGIIYNGGLRGWAKLESLSWMGIMLCVVYWFILVYAGDRAVPNQLDELGISTTEVSAVWSAFLAWIAMVVAMALKFIKVPFCVTFTIYSGCIMFGF